MVKAKVVDSLLAIIIYYTNVYIYTPRVYIHGGYKIGNRIVGIGIIPAISSLIIILSSEMR